MPVPEFGKFLTALNPPAEGVAPVILVAVPATQTKLISTFPILQLVQVTVTFCPGVYASPPLGEVRVIDLVVPQGLEVVCDSLKAGSTSHCEIVGSSAGTLYIAGILGV